MVTDNRALGVEFGYAKRLKGVWEIAHSGLGISAQSADLGGGLAILMLR